MCYRRDRAACSLRGAAEVLGLAERGGEKGSGQLVGCQDPQGCRREAGARLFAVVPGGTAGANRYKLKRERFCLVVRRNFLTMMTVKQWTRVPSEVV